MVLPDVAACMGVSSWESFQARCGPVAENIRRAEALLQEQGRGKLKMPDWVACVHAPHPKMQHAWSVKMKEDGRDQLLARLGDDDRVDFRSAGGPGRGGSCSPQCRSKVLRTSRCLILIFL